MWEINLKEIKEELIKFQKEREWEQFHSPENLAKSISIESGELLEHFQWNNDYNKEELADELADVLNYCFLLSYALDMDIKEIILNKLRKNKIKYPVSKSKGVSTKYNKL